MKECKRRSQEGVADAALEASQTSPCRSWEAMSGRPLRDVPLKPSQICSLMCETEDV